MVLGELSSPDTLTAIIVAVIGAAVPTIALLRTRRTDREQAEAAQVARIEEGHKSAIEGFNELTDQLQEEVTKLRTQGDERDKRLDRLEQDHRDCERRNTQLMAEVTALKSNLEMVTRPVRDALTEVLDRNRKQLGVDLPDEPTP